MKHPVQKIFIFPFSGPQRQSLIVQRQSKETEKEEKNNPQDEIRERMKTTWYQVRIKAITYQCSWKWFPDRKWSYSDMLVGRGKS